MDVPQLYTGITHPALTVSSIEHARAFMRQHDIAESGSFRIGRMSAVFMPDPDRNVIELDAYDDHDESQGDYAQHP